MEFIKVNRDYIEKYKCKFLKIFDISKNINYIEKNHISDWFWYSDSDRSFINEKECLYISFGKYLNHNYSLFRLV